MRGSGSPIAGGVTLALVGVLIVCQVLKGNALDRLGITG
jgi:hypothetical protein